MPRPVVRRHPLPKPMAHTPATAVEAEGAAVPNENSKKGEIRAYLRTKGVAYTTRMSKEELLELL